MEQEQLARVVYKCVSERAKLMKSLRWYIENPQGYHAVVVEMDGKWGYRVSYPSHEGVHKDFIFCDSEHDAKVRAEQSIRDISGTQELDQWRDLEKFLYFRTENGIVLPYPKDKQDEFLNLPFGVSAT